MSHLLESWWACDYFHQQRIVEMILYDLLSHEMPCSFSLVFMGLLLPGVPSWNPVARLGEVQATWRGHMEVFWSAIPSFSCPSPRARHVSEETTEWFQLSALHVTPACHIFPDETADMMEKRWIISTVPCLNSCEHNKICDHKICENNKMTVILCH